MLGSMSTKVSFIVIAHNEAGNIERTLISIQNQNARWREVLVIDDGSTDETAELVRTLAVKDPSIRLICLPSNQGRGAARSRGISEARGEFIATVDADIVLPSDWLARCVSALGDADVVAGIAVPDGDVAYLHSRFALNPKVRAHTTAATGSNAVYRRSVFERVSFDASLHEGEDVALSHALAAAGARVRTVPGLITLHCESKSFLASLVWMQQSGRGAARQLRRYRQVRPPDLAFGGWLLCWIAGVWLGRCSRAWGWVLPQGYVLVVAGRHVSGAFRWERGRPAPFLGAVLTDVALLHGYFWGRIAGSLTRSSPWAR